MMRIYKENDYTGMSARVAQILAAQVLLQPDSVLGLATGSTPLGAYEKLIEWHRNGDLDFSGITAFNLDEYKGLAPENDQSYRHYMIQNLFRHINISLENTFIPDGLAEDAARECVRYDEQISGSGGIDLQLLGLGNNGHIGFNEPGDAFSTGVHCVTLAQSTIDANKRFFAREEDVPRQAYTVGIRAIMQAKKVVVAVSGAAKAEIVREAFFGPVTPQVPASILQLHDNVTLVGDKAALACL